MKFEVENHDIARGLHKSGLSLCKFGNDYAYTHSDSCIESVQTMEKCVLISAEGGERHQHLRYLGLDDRLPTMGSLQARALAPNQPEEGELG